MPSHSPFLFLLPLFFFIPLPSPYIVDNVNTTIARAQHISIVSFHFHSIAPCLFVPVPGELGKTGERKSHHAKVCTHACMRRLPLAATANHDDRLCVNNAFPTTGKLCYCSIFPTQITQNSSNIPMPIIFQSLTL